MDLIYKKFKVCAGKKDLLCPYYTHKEKLSSELTVCPKCESELIEQKELNKTLISIFIALLVIVIAGIIYITTIKKEKQVQQITVTESIDVTKLINTYVGSVEVDSMKYLSLILEIKDVIKDDNGNYSFNFNLNTKDYRDKGIGTIYPMYNKIFFASAKLNYNFTGDYKYENSRIIIIGDNKKWQLKAK
ncbi:MAG TPA: hypothetical protein PLI27_06630 [Ignavibacteriales bacterium]|nr:hypothetical protein [Ignavibacteriales bacterium]HOL81373.1 hypothetical protein [Ignavibacteriales bacterium]HOM65488.1 hypothetical protein [Ignavibacteriales bacterium]HPD67733.1 hypothetical protein [Ignavibacteriales bacterium]HPP33858.1 hypothetical protein [Ignavibacteriales bacterium]